MSGGRPNDETPSPRADWRGRSRSRRSIQHRWQKRTTQQRTGRPLRTMLRSSVLVAVLLGMSLGFVYLMRFRPRQTPVVAIVATQYAAPFAPNGWAFEDLEALRSLDADTVVLLDASEDVGRRDAMLAEIDRLVRDASGAIRRDEPIIVYLSMHVDTDDDGRPALIPTDASPLDAGTWVLFEDVVERIVSSRQDEQCPVLLVLDCHRHVGNWHRAESVNTFVDAVQSRLLARPAENLTVMTSCSSGEQSLAFHGRKQTSFGYYFVEGLRGRADDSPVGNGDHYVSLQELTDFVTRNVAGYSRSVLGVSQTVRLMAAGESEPPDFTVGWVSTESRPRAVDRSAGTAIDMADLWQSYEAVSQRQPQIAFPMEWAHVQSRLMRLEQLVDAGAAYQAQAAMESNQITLAINRLHGQLDPADTDAVAAQIRQQTVDASAAATAGDLHAAVQDIAQQSAPSDSPTFHFASLLARQKGHACWKFAGLVRDAVTTRALAEATWKEIPAGRLPWCVAQLDVADGYRRQAEDRLLLGQNAQDGFRMATAAYQQAAERSAQTEQAVTALATALSELVWLTRWRAASADPSTEELLELMEATHRLAGGLSDSRSQLASLAILPFTNPTRQVARGLQQQRTELTTEYAKLLREMTTSTQDIHRALALLETPLLPTADPASGTTGAAQRQQLRRKLRAAVTERVNNSSLSDAESAVDPGGQSAEEQMLVQHLLAVQNRDVERDAETGQLSSADRSLRFRDSMQQIFADCQVALTASQPVISDYRQQLINSEFRLRLIAPLYVPPGFVNTIAARQRLDQGVQTIDLCQRTLDDFYGPLAVGEEPWFSRIVGAQLTSFREQQDEPISVRRQLVEMNGLLDRRRQLLTEGLSVRASSVLLLGASQLDAVGVQVQADGSLERFDMPPITGSLYFADADNAVLSNTAALPLIPQSGPTETNFSGRLKLTPRGVQNASAQVFAVANLRGNVIREPVLVSRAGGAETATSVNAAESATVDVRGRAAAGRSIVVIFDCSQSMATPIAAEVAGAQTRFDAGLRALSHLLNGLAGQSDARVGLMLFGHRVGWNPENPRQMLINDDYPRGVPGELRPFDDVELVLPVGRFDTATLQAAAPLLDSLRPWGETPLYLSMTDAFTALATEDERRARRVIVLTDGVDRQTNPSFARKRTLQNVLDALPAGVQVDIVGYQIARQDAQQAQVAFDAIARASGGQFQAVDDLTALLQSLSGLLETDEFRLRRDGQIITSTPGQSVTVNLTEAEQTIAIDMGEARAEFPLQGGEAVVWQLSEDGRRLEVPRWDEGTPRWVPLLSPGSGNASGLECGLQTMSRQDDVARLVLSVQDSRGQFAARPVSIHVHLHGLNEQGQRVGDTYLCDAFGFLSQTPVPAVSVEAHGWHPQATQAEVRVFVQQQRIEPVDRIALGALALKPGTEPLSQPVSGVNDVMVYVIADRQRSRVTIVEQHGAASPGPGALIVQLSGAAGRSFQQRQRIDSSHRVVSTVLEFDESDGIPLANGTLEFILRSEAEQHALPSHHPVTLPVSNDSGLLIPTD